LVLLGLTGYSALRVAADFLFAARRSQMTDLDRGRVAPQECPDLQIKPRTACVSFITRLKEAVRPGGTFVRTPGSVGIYPTISAFTN
jgi:hypothetical protein